MKLTVVERSELCRMSYKRCKLQSLFEEFIAMDTPVVRVDAYEYKSPAVAAAVLQNGARRWAKNVSVMRRGNSVYLVRKDMED